MWVHHVVAAVSNVLSMNLKSLVLCTGVRGRSPDVLYCVMAWNVSLCALGFPKSLLWRNPSLCNSCPTARPYFGSGLLCSLSRLSCSSWAQPDKSMQCKAEKTSSRLAEERWLHSLSIWYCLSMESKPASSSTRSSCWSDNASRRRNSFHLRKGTSLIIAYRTTADSDGPSCLTALYSAFGRRGQIWAGCCDVAGQWLRAIMGVSSVMLNVSVVGLLPWWLCCSLNLGSSACGPSSLLVLLWRHLFGFPELFLVKNSSSPNSTKNVITTTQRTSQGK